MCLRVGDYPRRVLPLPPGPITNGEFVPETPSREDGAVLRDMVERTDASARRAGMDRRRFLECAGAVAAALAAYNLAACSSSRRSPTAAASSSTPGGVFIAPPPEDVPACAEALGGTEFVFDVHTHHVMPEAPWTTNAPETVQLVEGMLPPDCMSADPLECVN